jgi:lipopolysaccharide/colanic/teichoic acid biosynthesis glycosyltransferase
MIQATLRRHNLKEKSAVKVEKKPRVARNQGQSNRLGSFLKLLLDYLLVVPGLLFLAPLLTCIALLIKLESPGPLIYRYRVVGRNGREFNAYKFRTMYINAEEILATYPRLEAELKKNYQLKCDPRLTRSGYFLHKFGLDDLPQLFNILKQEMSLVGPRVVTYKDLMKYGEYRHTLLTVLPGLTGVWQVNGHAGLTFENRIEMDMEYIHNWSIMKDVKIILQTIPALLKGDRAY